MARSIVSAMLLVAGAAIMLAAGGTAFAAGCNFQSLGHGRAASVIDPRTFRLEDGRDIRLTGIEPTTDTAAGIATLSALVIGRDVVLRGESEDPDRYGRQHAFAFVEAADATVQHSLLNAGTALASGTVSDKGCAADLAAAETSARQAKRGIWQQPDVIKNAENAGELLAKLGRFTLAEGIVLSARQAGSTFYLNFGRRWAQDFAVIIPRQMLRSLERDGINLKALQNRRVRVRGWVERRGGPRIEIFGAGQIEAMDDQ